MKQHRPSPGDTNEALNKALKQLGGYEATGRLCGVSGKAVMKWYKRGRLPRTEWTGETRYAEIIAAATGITRAALRPDLFGDALSLAQQQRKPRRRASNQAIFTGP